MKTTSEQLLARAEELETRAKALRISAAEMNGHQTAEKRGKVKELFQAATKIRKAVTVWDAPEPKPEAPELPPLPKRKRYKSSELAPYLLRILDGATRPTTEVQSILADQGTRLSVSQLRKHLLTLPQVGREQSGRGAESRWLLKAGEAGKAKAGRQLGAKWTPAQHKKFRATMKRKSAATRAKLAKLAAIEQIHVADQS